jgi:uncharacterized membrane protein YobD (UPF0266 family)
MIFDRKQLTFTNIESVVNTVFHTIIGVIVFATVGLESLLSVDTYMNTGYSNTLVVISMAVIIAHNILDYWLNRAKMPKAMIAHHIIGIVVPITLLSTGKGIMFGGLCLLYETGSCLYNISVILVRDSPLHKFCLNAFAVVFIATRWIFYPYLLIGENGVYAMFNKVYQDYPEERPQIVFLKVFMGLFNILNFYWGCVIIQKAFASTKSLQSNAVTVVKKRKHKLCLDMDEVF